MVASSSIGALPLSSKHFLTDATRNVLRSFMLSWKNPPSTALTRLSTNVEMSFGAINLVLYDAAHTP